MSTRIGEIVYVTVWGFLLFQGADHMWDSDGDGRAGRSSLAYKRCRR